MLVLKAMLTGIGRGSTIASNTLARTCVDILIPRFLVYVVRVAIVMDITLRILETRSKGIIEYTSLSRYILLLLWYKLGIISHR